MFNKQKIIFNLLFSLCLIIAIPVFLWSQNPPLAHWAVNELLINYAGGFVRRGLIGEITFLLSDSGEAQLKILYLCFVFLHLSILFFLYRLLNQYRNQLFIVSLVLFSPALFLFPFYDYGAYFRKEAFVIMVLFAHAFFVKFNFNYKQTDNKKMIEVWYMLILFSSILICMMIHEIQFFVIPVHALITYNYCKMKNITLKPFAFFYLLTLASMIIPVTYHGDSTIASIIRDSYQNKFQLPNQISGIDAVGWTASDTLETAALVYKDPTSLKYYGYAIILTLLPLILVAIRIIKTKSYIEIYSKSTFILATSTAFISISPLFYIGCDWGRWIHVGGMSTLAFLLTFDLNLRKKEEQFNSKISNHQMIRLTTIIIIFLILFLYSTAWTLPHCCTIENLRGELNNNISFYFFYILLSKFFLI